MRPQIKAIMRVEIFCRGDGIAQNNALKRTFFVSNCPQTFSFVVCMATGGGGGARGCRGDLSRPIHARENLLQKGFVESFTQPSAQFVTMSMEILHHSACDALLAGRGNFVDTNCFPGVQMSKRPKLAVL